MEPNLSHHPQILGHYISMMRVPGLHRDWRQSFIRVHKVPL